MSKRRDTSSAEPEGDRVKLFPRNLTAMAASRVLGNPASSRPESGVDNSFPGLEWDPRSLEEIFFPKLRFDYHRGNGAFLIDGAPEVLSGPEFESLRASGEDLYLWGLFLLDEEGEVEATDCDGLRGPEIWRIVRQIGQRPVAILLGSGPKPHVRLTRVREQAHQLLIAHSGDEPSSPVACRDQDHVALLLAARRSPYLTKEGVIDPKRLPPGEITKTMCAPWMYDFRDCYCYYWAANKPDMLSPPEPERPPTNFLRRDRSDPPAVDLARFWDRREHELTHADMVEGWWERLPIALSDRETRRSESRHRTRNAGFLSRDEFVARLGLLAQLEHAVLIEYLFAYYSLRCDASASTAAEAAAHARSELFPIAKDEMRHFLWVNRVLQLLDAPPSVGRAAVIQEAPSEGRTAQEDIVRPFRLRRLEPETLQDFIDVEQPSQEIGTGLDGMYVNILESLAQGKIAELPERDLIAPMMKLIVDEGDDHYRRLLSVQRTLADLNPQDYLYRLGPPKTENDRRYLDLADLYYNAVLDAIEASFTLTGTARSDLLVSSIRSMENLDDVANILVRRGVSIRFALEPRGAHRDARTARNKMIGRQQALSATLGEISGSSDNHIRLGDHLERNARFAGEAERLLSSADES